MSKMTLSKFCESFSTLLSVNSLEVETRAKYLREAGMLPVGGRGLFAPEISEEDEAKIIFSIMSTGIQRNAPQTTIQCSALKKDGKDYSSTLLEELTEILSSSEKAYNVEELVISRTFPKAVIKFTSGESFVFLPEGESSLHGQAPFEIFASLSGDILHQLTCESEFRAKYPNRLKFKEQVVGESNE